MKRRTVLKGGALMALASAGYLSSTIFSTAQAQDRKVLTIANPSGFPDLDPATSFSGDNAVLANCYETLTRYVPDMAAGTGQIEPLLAESWEASEDGLTWTFKLRDGVTFSDGEKLTSAAVKAAVERTQSIGGGASFIWWALESIDTPDELTVVFNLSASQPVDLIASAGYAAWIQSPASIEQDNAWFNQGNSAGTGPYTIRSYEPGQRCILQRNPNYWGGSGEGKFDNVVLEVVEDNVLAQNMIESGQADFTYEVPFENLDSLKQNPDLNIVVNPSFQNLFGLFNVKKAPLDNPKVRQALSLAYPYDDVIFAATNGLGTRSRGIIPPGIWGHDPDAPVPNTDLDAAKALLDEAGVNGLELTITYATGDPTQGVMAELWRANLAKLGVTLNLQPMSWEAQWELSKADPANAQDIFVMYWWPTFVTPHDFMFSLFHTEDSPNFNLGYYSNPAFDKLLGEAGLLASSDRDKAAEIYKQAQNLLIGDAAAVFMLDLPNVHILRASIKGYVDNPAYGHVVFADQLS